VQLTWDEVPEGSIAGFNVYRVVGSSLLPLNANGYVIDPGFVDSGADFVPQGLPAGDGQTYSYVVEAVYFDGTTAQSAPTMPVAPAVGPALTLQGLPADGPVGGQIGLSCLTSTGEVPSDGVLLVDGSAYVGVPDDGDGCAPPAFILGLDTTQFANGAHVIQAVCTSSAGLVATQPMTIRTQNDFSAQSCGGFVETDTGELAQFQAAPPANATSWQIELHEGGPAGTLVRGWYSGQPAGLGSVAWDGTDGTGATMAPDGNYTLVMTATGSAGNASSISYGVSKISSKPNMLGLVDHIYPSRPVQVAVDMAYARSVCELFSEATQEYGLVGLVLLPGHTVKTSDIAKWFRSSLTDFIIYGHGRLEDPISGVCHAFRWNNTLFWRFQKDPGSLPGKDNVVVYPALNGQRPYFVFLDCCDSAGGDPPFFTLPAPGPDLSWADAFNIGQDPLGNQIFVGWNGQAGGGTNRVFGNQYVFNDWYQWQTVFYQQLLQGQTVDNSWSAACSLARDWLPQGVIHAWDPGRFFDVGDLWANFPEYGNWGGEDD
jgi:hypothetical protein